MIDRNPAQLLKIRESTPTYYSSNHTAKFQVQSQYPDQKNRLPLTKFVVTSNPSKPATVVLSIITRSCGSSFKTVDEAPLLTCGAPDLKTWCSGTQSTRSIYPTDRGKSSSLP